MNSLANDPGDASATHGDDARPADQAQADPAGGDTTREAEYGGPKGPEPTRYGDWEKNGRCIDF